jgi:hypothetical protein
MVQKVRGRLGDVLNELQRANARSEGGRVGDVGTVLVRRISKCERLRQFELRGRVYGI